MLHHHRLSMREVPVQMYERGGGRSSISTGKSAYYMVKVLLALLVGLASAATRGRRRANTPPSSRSADLMDDRIQLVAIVAAGRCSSWCSSWCAGDG